MARSDDRGLVLVTGATGCVGAHLARALLDLGRPVRLLCRDPERLPTNLSEHPSVEVIEGDLRLSYTVAEAPEGCSTVFHCAASMPGGPDTPGEMETVNRAGTLAVGTAASRAGVKRFVFLSSTAAAPATALSEDEDVDEDQLGTEPLKGELPIDLAYGRSKRYGEQLMTEYMRHKHGMQTVVLRPPMVAGWGLRGGPLLEMLKLCRKGRFPVFGDDVLNARKPLISVQDCVLALLLAERRGHDKQAYFVHSGTPSLREILTAAGGVVGRPKPWIELSMRTARAAVKAGPLFKLIGRRPPLTQERLDTFLADRPISIDKARRELGFEPKVTDLERMLSETHRWFVQSGQLRA